MQPLHARASKLKVVQENIDQAIESTNTVLEAFGTGRDVEATLKDGYRGDVDEYLGCIDRCSKSIAYLKQHENFKSSPKAISHLETLIELGLREAANVAKEGFAKFAETLDVSKLADNNEPIGNF